jgi:putative NADH-flavin reductase
MSTTVATPRPRSLRILLIGASGRTGRAVADQAVRRGHIVTALVRRAESMGPCNGMAVVVGDILDPWHFAAAATGHDIIISALARGAQQTAVLTASADVVVTTLHEATDAPRYLVVSQALLFASANPIVCILRWMLGRAVADSAGMEQLITASTLDWTIVRPPRLTEAARRRGYRALADARPSGSPSMARADLATFLIDEAERGRFRRRIVGVG